ncbi:hypothetical protein ACFLWY_01370 [Chloroflexota bacterium]
MANLVMKLNARIVRDVIINIRRYIKRLFNNPIPFFPFPLARGRGRDFSRGASVPLQHPGVVVKRFHAKTAGLLSIAFLLISLTALVGSPGIVASDDNHPPQQNLSSSLNRAARTPGENEWSIFAFPQAGEAGNWLYDPSITRVGPIDRAIDGTLYCYVGLGAANEHVMKSTDGGHSWSKTDYENDVNGDDIVDIACSSTDANSLYATDGAHVYYTNNGGGAWAMVADASLNLAVDEAITCIDISYAENGDAYVFIGTATAGYAGSVYYVSQAGSTQWTNLDIQSGANDTLDVYAIAASPNFASDEQIYALVTDATPYTAVLKKTHGAVGDWYEVAELSTDTDADGDYDDAFEVTGASRFVFPSDFDGEYEWFVGTTCVTGTGLGSVHRINDDIAYNLGAWDADIDRDVVSLDLVGAYGSVQMVAGTLAGESDKVLVSTDDGERWDDTAKDPIGAGDTYVVMDKDFADNGTAWAAVSGVDGGVSESTDTAQHFNQISMINVNIDQVIAIDFAGDTMLMLINDATSNNESIWMKGSGWERVYVSAALDMLQASLYNNMDDTIFTADSATQTIYRTTNGGDKWKELGVAPTALLSWVVIDDSTIIAGGNGAVYITDTYGRRKWTTGTVTGAGNIIDLALSPNFSADSTVLAGDDDGTIFISEDAGSTWDKVGYAIGASANVYVAFDPDYADNHTIYAATANEVDRCVINVSQPWTEPDWEEFTHASLGINAASGIVVTGEGLLYVSDRNPGTGVWRSLNPGAARIGDALFEQLNTNLDATAELINLQATGGSNILWCTNAEAGAEYELWTYEDSRQIIMETEMMMGQDQADGGAVNITGDHAVGIAPQMVRLFNVGTGDPVSGTLLSDYCARLAYDGTGIKVLSIRGCDASGTYEKTVQTSGSCEGSTPTSTATVRGIEPPHENRWSTFPFPQAGEDGDWLYDPSITNVGPLAQAIDGTLYCYVELGASNDHLMKSTDGGHYWSKTDYEKDVNGDDIVDIACCEIDANILYVTDGTHVYWTHNGGGKWETVADASLQTQLSPGETITCVDAGYLDSDYFAFIGTATGGYAGSVYYINQNGYPSQWMDLMVEDGTDTKVWNVYAFATSPGFTDYPQIYALVTNATPYTAVLRNTYGAVGDWDEVAELTDSAGVAFECEDASRFCFPGDFAVSGPFEMFVGASAVGIQNGSVHRINYGIAYNLGTGDADVDVDVVSLDLVGLHGSTRMLAGAEAGTTNNVVVSTDDGSNWYRADKNPVGPGDAYVTMDENFAVNGTAWVAIDGADGGLSLTTDAGAIYSQISLINTGIDAVLDVAFPSDYATDNIMFLLTADAATGTESLWKYDGSNWIRVYVGAALDRLQVSPYYTADDTLFVALSGASPDIYRSTNGGDYLKALDLNPTELFSWVVIDDCTIIAGGNGAVYITDDYGRRQWTMETITGAGNIVDLELCPGYSLDLTIIASDDSGGIFISEDAGDTWDRMGYAIGAAANVYVAFDPEYADNHTIYAATANEIDRCVIDMGKPWSEQSWEEFAHASLGINAASGIVVTSDGLLFVSDQNPGAGVWRSLNPSAARIGDALFEQLITNLDATAELINLQATGGSNILWCTNAEAGAKYELWAYKDTRETITSFCGTFPDSMEAPLIPAFALLRLIGDCTTSYDVALTWVDIVDTEGSHVPPEATVVKTFQRGDIKADGSVNIADALYARQYLAGTREIDYVGGDTNKVNPANMASVRQDGAFDVKTVADALFIRQYLAGIRDANFIYTE